MHCHLAVMATRKMKAETMAMNNNVATNEVVQRDGDLGAALTANVVVTIDS